MRDPQTGTANPCFSYIDLHAFTETDTTILFNSPVSYTLRINHCCAKLGRFALLFSCKMKPNSVFWPPAGPPAAPPAGPPRPGRRSFGSLRSPDFSPLCRQPTSRLESVSWQANPANYYLGGNSSQLTVP